MTDTTTHHNLKKERFPLTTGTVLFVFTVFLLVAGFCRFSFYVLKNHRSAVARDTFIQSYVDVQPFARPDSKEDSYIKLSDTGLATISPAVFFKEKTVVEEPKPEKTAAYHPLTVPVPDFRRPPVVRSPVKKEADPRSNETENAAADDDSSSLALASLISSAEDTLDETDETVLKSEPILSEKREPVVEKESETIVAKADVPPSLPAAQTKAEPAKAPEKAKTAANREHWIDIASLREQIKAEADKQIRAEADKQAAANAAFAAANATAKADAASTESDGVAPRAQVHPAAPARDDVPPAPQSPVKEPPAVIAANLPAQAGTIGKAPETTAPEGTAVLAAKLLAPADVIKEAQKQTTAQARPARPANPWLVSKVAGKAHNMLAVHDYRVKEQPETEKKETSPAKTDNKKKEPAPVLTALSEQTAEKALEKKTKTVFYRNGRKKETAFSAEDEPSAPVSALPVEERDLNWLDRKQAAVWTSLSQTDAPSVWKESDSEKSAARAFRVADEIPADAGTTEDPAPAAEEKSVSSKPVITVGEKPKAESKKDPVLLPLGAPEEAKITANSVPKGAPVSIAAFPVDGQTADSKQASAPAQAAGTNEGLINKMKSLFNIGGDTTASAAPDLGGAAVQETPKPAAPAVAAAQQQPVQNVPVFIPAASQTAKSDVLPAEIRLTFKPNSAEMSAQAVKWVKAFGMRVKKDIQHAVEVRMSSENFPLQEKRFALIRSTLVGVGVQDTQILPVVSDRTPHTIVLKTLDIPEEGLSSYETSVNGVKEKLYYRRW